MAGNIEEAGVRFVVENLTAYLAGIETANGKTAEVGTKTETAATKSGLAWGKIGKAAGLAALAVGTAAVAIGAAALKIASDLDGAYDSIQVKTGETGLKLDGLKASFEHVFENVPSSAEDVANAIGTLNQKLDLTGTPLETVAEQVLNLSRITGTDLTANVDAVAGAFQRWQTPAEAMPGLLDLLFKASQESGVPVADLATSLGDNKAIIEGLGLSLPAGIELIGALGKAGVNSDTAFAGLKFAMTKMVKEGVEDPASKLQEYFDRIKNAPTDAAAAAIATEIFGKNAVTMAGNIRDGSFDLAGFTKNVDAHELSINETAGATDDWKEKLEILRNRVIVAISPALNAMFGGLTDLVDDLQPHLDDFSDWWKDTATPAIKGFWADAEPIIKALGKAFQTAWDILEPIFSAIVENLDLVLETVGNLVSLVSALIQGDWSAAWQSAKDIVDGVLQFVINIHTAIFDAAVNLASAIWDGLDSIPIVSNVKDLIYDAIKAIIELVGAAMEAGKALFDNVWQGIQSIPLVGDAIGIIWDMIKGLLGLAGTFLAIGKAWFGAIWSGIQAVWESIKDWVANLDIPWPDLTPPWGGVDMVVDFNLIPGELNTDPEAFKTWLLDWFAHKDDAERLRQQMQEAWQAFLDEHPLEIKPSLVVDVPDFLLRPVPDTKTIPDDSNPFKLRPIPDTRPIPDDSNPLKKKPGDTKDKPSLKDISDPAQFLELVLHAIATIEALADANIAPVNKKKLLTLANGLRSIIKEFGRAMAGIKPDVAEAAAIIAGLLDPILNAIDQGVDTIDAIAKGGGVSQDRIKAVIGALRAITVEASKAFAGLDSSKLTATAKTAVIIEGLMASLAAAARDAYTLANTGQTDNGKPVGGGGIPGTSGGVDVGAILAGILGSMPRAGSTLAGAPGGVSYHVNATYVNPQTPASIRLDLQEIQLLSSA